VTASEQRVIARMKRKFFNHIVNLSMKFHTTHKTGSLISKLTRGSRSIESIMDIMYYNIASTIFQFIIVTITLLYIDITSALIIFIVFIAFASFSLFIERYRFKARQEANDAEDDEKANVGDVIMNIESVKYFAKEKAMHERYYGLSERTKRAFTRTWNYSRIQSAGQVFILGSGAIAIIYFSLQGFLAGTITLGTLAFVYTTYTTVAGSLYSFVEGMKSFSQAIADFENVDKYDDVKNDIVDAPHAVPLKITRGEIEFRNVTFGYNQRKIFQDFNLKIPQNKKVAIVGASGSGKSTLVKLIYRLYDLQKGEIIIDGRNIATVPQESLRESLSIVPQECVLFDDTIYNNILFSRPEATREEVLQAMRFAQLDKIIANFPHKENTIVGERGVKLSGGEKQRVSIARAILADKKVLVLDEATSSLDSETEHDIQQDLAKLMRGRTSIIIAHRLSTIMSADMIVVLENGKIVQSGTHKQLIKQKGRYKKLWSLQKGGYIK
jgi:ATP-binding cassette, subfamily B, heavy metal transporter